MRPKRPASTAALSDTRGIAEARLKNRTDAHAGLRGFVQDVIRAFDGGVERLLDHQMFAGTDRRERGHEMQRRRRGDAHRVEPGLREQLIDVVRDETRCRAPPANFSAVARVRLTTPTSRPPFAAATARA